MMPHGKNQHRPGEKSYSSASDQLVCQDSKGENKVLIGRFHTRCIFGVLIMRVEGQAMHEWCCSSYLTTGTYSGTRMGRETNGY